MPTNNSLSAPVSGSSLPFSERAQDDPLARRRK
jgi:hypothetical protein